ncbi:TPA: DUF4156 domain-containing protein [Legionella anisa]|nr:DUF4156 domain-containing protein [Legionella anisa]
MIFFLTLQVVVGCVPRSLEPDAVKVVIIYGQNTKMPKPCKPLGKISNRDVHGRKLQFSLGLEQNLKIDDINFLKNEGAKLGANVVVFEEHQTLIERHHALPGRTTDISMHVIYAKTYQCPSNLINKMQKQLNGVHNVYKNPVVIKIIN